MISTDNNQRKLTNVFLQGSDIQDSLTTVLLSLKHVETKLIHLTQRHQNTTHFSPLGVALAPPMVQSSSLRKIEYTLTFLNQNRPWISPAPGSAPGPVGSVGKVHFLRELVQSSVHKF